MPESKCNCQTNGQGRELKLHGSLQLPAAFYHDDLLQESVPWHWHDEMEVAVVAEGTAVIAAGTEKYTMREGDAIFINGGTLHAAWAGDAGHSRIRSIVFHPRLVGGSHDSVFWRKYLRPVAEHPALTTLRLSPGLPWQKDVIQCIEKAWSCGVGEEHGYEFTVREWLSRLVLLLSDQTPAMTALPSEKSLRDGERIKTMLDFIHGHFGDALTVQEIAARAFISESECLRCFRSTIGSTPIQYLRTVRLQHAAERLATSEDKITRIGTDCGFQDMSYFARAFQSVYGCTPSAYRESQRKR